MDRRAFIAAGAGATLVAVRGHAAHSGRARATIPTYVTGLRDHAGRGALPAPGTALELARRPDRPFDPMSIAVLGRDGRVLGHLPAAQGGVLAPLMDAGLRLGATVTRARAGTAPRLELALDWVGADQET